MKGNGGFHADEQDFFLEGGELRRGMILTDDDEKGWILPGFVWTKGHCCLLPSYHTLSLNELLKQA